MHEHAWLRFAAFGGAFLLATTARAQSTGTPTLAASDFTLTLARADGHVLTSDELDIYFSRARCACATDLTAALAISSDAAAKLGDSVVEAQFMIGNNCSSSDVTCPTAGSVRLSAATTAGEASLSTSRIFDAAVGGDCNAAKTSTRFWAIVLVDGVPPSSQPSLLLTLGGAGPAAPSDVKTVSADQGLLVSWSSTDDGTNLLGYQVLCAPGPATASAASWDTCGVPAPSSDGGTDGGAGPFASLDPQFVCSGLVAAGTNSTRVHGLENGRTYQIAVVAVGLDGTPSAPSPVADGTPAPTVGFGDLYADSGGTATGCAVGGGAIAPGITLALLGAAAPSGGGEASKARRLPTRSSPCSRSSVPASPWSRGPPPRPSTKT
jgi:hypothetical protein